MRGPQGDKFGRTYKENYWTSEPRRGQDSELLDVIQSDLDDLEKRSSFLAELSSTGGNIQYYVSWFAEGRAGGVVISPEILGRLASLSIYLALDVYSARSSGESHSLPAAEPGG